MIAGGIRIRVVGSCDALQVSPLADVERIMVFQSKPSTAVADVATAIAVMDQVAVRLRFAAANLSSSVRADIPGLPS